MKTLTFFGKNIKFLGLFLVMLMGSFTSTFAVTLYVAPGGNDVGNNCQNPASPCGTIQHAIDEASNGDIVDLEVGTYFENITIFKNITLRGSGSLLTTIDGGGNGSVVRTAGEITIEYLTITNGSSSQGGGIYNSGVGSLMLVLNSVIITDNEATSIDGAGGGIYNSGGGYQEGPDGLEPGQYGGLISMAECIIVGNRASFGGGGGICNAGAWVDGSKGGNVVIGRSIIMNNVQTEYGGGIVNERGVGEDGAGYVYVGHSRVSGNETTTDGGGIHNEGHVFAFNSQIESNVGEIDGGGIYSDGLLELSKTTVSNNKAQRGGGIYNMDNGKLALNNTISNNEAEDFGGGIYNQGTLRLIGYNTVAENAAPVGGGIYNIGDQRTNIGLVELSRTIVADQNQGEDCVNINGTISSQGYNLDSDNTCNLVQATDIPSGNANLGPLQINGPGDNATHALLAGSDAIDAIPIVDCNWASDQRGIARPQGPGCDIGAYEALGDRKKQKRSKKRQVVSNKRGFFNKLAHVLFLGFAWQTSQHKDFPNTEPRPTSSSLIHCFSVKWGHRIIRLDLVSHYFYPQNLRPDQLPNYGFALDIFLAMALCKKEW